MLQMSVLCGVSVTVIININKNHVMKNFLKMTSLHYEYNALSPKNYNLQNLIGQI